jgi:hypothetical protein
VTINWVLPRVYVPTPVWRIRTAAMLTAVVRPRREAAPARNTQAAAAPLDRGTARALADAGYMPLQRYVELFGDEEAGEGEV